MGADDWKSAIAVYAEKVSAEPPDEESSEVADWGRIFEPTILKRYAEKSSRRVVRGGKLMRSVRAAHHLTTLDGVQFTRPPTGARGPGVAEVKTTGFGSEYKLDLPVRVQVQIQWELWVTGAEWATCIWLPFPERRMQWADVLPNRAFHEVMVDAVDNFWRRVQRRLPPDPDGSESSMLALRRLFPEERDEVIRIAGPGVCSLADEYERNRAALELIKDRQGLIKNTLAATMRESKYAVLDDGRYWGSASYKERTTNCKHCGEVLSKTDGYRTYQLREPKKKPFRNILETRALAAPIEPLVVDVAEVGDGLSKQLSESLVGTPGASNDARGAA